MPRFHESVVYCDPCDQYVASIETDVCDAPNCRERYCPDCRCATDDENLFACSKHCADLINWNDLSSMRPAQSALRNLQPVRV